MMRIFFLLTLNFFTLSIWGALSPAIREHLEPLLLEHIEDQTLVEELFSKGTVKREGDDHTLRPDFVTSQALVERGLAELLEDAKISQCAGAIHTPMPPTPLCLAKKVSKSLVTPEIAEDQKRIDTVTMRRETLKAFLRAGSKLLSIYPSENYHKRSDKERAAYEEHLVRFESSLYNCPIKEPLPDELIGATYYFVDQEGEAYFFSIQSTQANDARDGRRWVLYLDSTHAKGADKRFALINAFIKQTTGFSLELLGKKA